MELKVGSYMSESRLGDDMSSNASTEHKEDIPIQLEATVIKLVTVYVTKVIDSQYLEH